MMKTKARFSTRFWLLLIILIAAAAAVALVIQKVTASGSVASIFLDGECIQTIDLDRVTEDYTFEITGDNYTNTVEVAPGKIRVVSSDCPDKICVNTGWISDSSKTIVCLPNRLVIKIDAESESDVDTVAK